MSDFFGVAPWMVLSGFVTWLGQAFIYRKDWKKIEFDHKAHIEASRDSLAIELLSSARAEVATAREEMEGLRHEMKPLRSMEQHFYHFQQALDHLSAVLFAKDDLEKSIAELNARAFLARMTRLQEAKGSSDDSNFTDSDLKSGEKTTTEERQV